MEDKLQANKIHKAYVGCYRRIAYMPSATFTSHLTGPAQAFTPSHPLLFLRTAVWSVRMALACVPRVVITPLTSC